MNRQKGVCFSCKQKSLACLLLFLPFLGVCQKSLVYKEIDTVSLSMQVYEPEVSKANKNHPALVLFYGGGWNGGKITQFEPHAEYFSAKGIVCFLVDYRVKTRHGTSPFESLKDAKSAIRFIKANHKRFKIDTTSIIAGGGSAGGHLAAATALIEGYNESTDDLGISCIPDALVLFNPVIDNGPGGYGFERIGSQYKIFSPLHNIKAGAPPTIIFLGTDDKLIPVETMEYYQIVMQKVGSRCDLHLYEGKKHGFFNKKKNDTTSYDDTLSKTEAFLKEMGYLTPG